MARSAESWDERSRPCVNNFALLSPQWTKRMATIHDEIDTWLAADLHGELSDSEQSTLHLHLLDCAACRKTHQEIKTMNKILEETLAQEKADPAFERRMLAGFRSRVPERRGLVKLLVGVMRLRATQIAAVAAALLGLVQIGRMITGEPVTVPRERERSSHVPMTLRRRQSRLRGRGAHASQGVHEGKPETAGEVGRLVEPAVAAPRSMKGNRHDTRDAGKNVGAAAAHQRSERLGQRSSAFVLERLQDRAERAVVVPDGARPVDGARHPPAAAAALG